MNEFDSVQDRWPVVPAEQSVKSWIVKLGAVISDIGEFSNVVQVNRSSKLNCAKTRCFFRRYKVYILAVVKFITDNSFCSIFHSKSTARIIWPLDYSVHQSFLPVFNSIIRTLYLSEGSSATKLTHLQETLSRNWANLAKICNSFMLQALINIE